MEGRREEEGWRRGERLAKGLFKASSLLALPVSPEAIGDTSQVMAPLS